MDTLNEFASLEIFNLLTIVIPCKNEGTTIIKTLDLLNTQKNINKINVIVCDSSDDDYTNPLLKNRKGDLFKLTITNGGLPANARNNGAKLVKTPYVLFMDSDIFLLDDDILINSVKEMINKDYNLITCKFRTTTSEYNYVYKVFDFIQMWVKYISPFALGGFMLFKRSIFNQLNGFDEKVKVAEDYMLSKQIKSNKFHVSKSVVYTTPRRFKSKGLIYMLKLMINSFMNRNNKTYFENDKNYWI